MPRGRKAEGRPADVTRNAVNVMRIVVAEEADYTPPDGGEKRSAQELVGLGGLASAKSNTEAPERDCKKTSSKRCADMSE